VVSCDDESFLRTLYQLFPSAYLSAKQSKSSAPLSINIMQGLSFRESTGFDACTSGVCNTTVSEATSSNERASWQALQTRKSEPLHFFDRFYIDLKGELLF
jgi:hypothetical protein